MTPENTTNPLERQGVASVLSNTVSTYIVGGEASQDKLWVTKTWFPSAKNADKEAEFDFIVMVASVLGLKYTIYNINSVYSNIHTNTYFGEANSLLFEYLT